MTKSIYRCMECHEYTLSTERCPHCGESVAPVHPARFSLEKEKKYSIYRRKMIESSAKK